jgi:hypothetical protein
MMSSVVNSGVTAMMNNHTEQCVRVLADKFGFDITEAMSELNLKDTKVVKEKKERKPKEPKEPKEAKKPKEPKEPKAKKDKKPKKEKDPNKPKRAATGYLLFSADIRAEIREELTEALDEDEKLKPQAVVQAIAVRWKALDEEEKTEWNDRAKELESSSSDGSSSESPKVVKAPSSVVEVGSDLELSDDEED